MKRSILSLLALALILPAAGAAKTVRAPGVESFCATRTSTTAISYARHQFNQRRLERQDGNRLAVGEPGIKQGFTVTKQKNIAVIEDDGTIFPPPNFFDLSSQGVQFRRSGAKTRAAVFFGGVSEARGDLIAIGDDQSRAIDLSFTFNFYGESYTRVILYSDGNLTFSLEDPEIISTARSVGRFLEGPPRIAVNFLDLDPSSATGQDGVYLLNRPDMLRITWLGVPQFDLSDSNTFQVTLYPGGRITMAYGNVDAQDGIVGVSPGGPGTINLVDLSQQLPLAAKTDAIAEQFRSVSEIDDLAAAKAVLSRVRDEYDILVLFSDFDVDLGGAFAYNAPVKNEIRGLGDGIYDLTNLYGSKGRLRAFVQMGSLANYPGGPNNAIPGFLGASGIDILAHEVGHRWLAFPTFINNQGQRSTDLLGRQMAHWSFLKDTDGSVMEGNDIRDNGDGTFTTVGVYEGFSPLDQYLMGLRRPDQVPQFFYVTGSDENPERAPRNGVAIEGTRVNVNINQIIAAVGPRVPAVTTKPTQVAFALLGRQGEPPSLASIKKVNQYRNRMSTYYRQETEDRGRIATWLRLRKQAVVAPDGASDGAAVAAAESGAAPDGAAEAAPQTPGDLGQRRDRRDEQTRR